MDGFDFHSDIAASPSLSIFATSRIVRGCEGKQSFCFELQTVEQGEYKCNVKTVLTVFRISIPVCVCPIPLISPPIFLISVLSLKSWGISESLLWKQDWILPAFHTHYEGDWLDFGGNECYGLPWAVIQLPTFCVSKEQTHS